MHVVKSISCGNLGISEPSWGIFQHRSDPPNIKYNYAVLFLRQIYSLFICFIYASKYFPHIPPLKLLKPSQMSESFHVPSRCILVNSYNWQIYFQSLKWLFFHFFKKYLAKYPNIYKNDVVMLLHVLACKMTSLVNKSADWPPNYHKIQIFSPPPLWNVYAQPK